MRIPLRASLLSMGLVITLAIPTSTTFAGKEGDNLSPESQRRLLTRKTAEAATLGQLLAGEQAAQEEEYAARYAAAQAASAATGVRISPMATPDGSPEKEEKPTPIRGFQARLAQSFTERMAALEEEKRKSKIASADLDRAEEELERAARATTATREELTKAQLALEEERQKSAQQAIAHAAAVEKFMQEIAKQKSRLELLTSQLTQRTASLAEAEAAFDAERLKIKAANRAEIDGLEQSQREKIRGLQDALNKEQANVAALTHEKERLETRVSKAEAEAAVFKTQADVFEHRDQDRRAAETARRAMGDYGDVAESSRGEGGSIFGSDSDREQASRALRNALAKLMESDDEDEDEDAKAKAKSAGALTRQGHPLQTLNA